MVSGHSGQAGRVARCPVTKELDVEFDAATTQHQATTENRVLEHTRRLSRAFSATVLVSLFARK